VKKYYQIFLLILFFIIPLVVNAYDTGKIESGRGIEDFSVEKIDVKSLRVTKYINLNGTGKAGYYFEGIVKNNYLRNVELEIVLQLYDEDQNVIDEFTATVKVASSSTGHYEQYVYSSDEYSIESIAYYSLSLDFLTNVEVTENNSVYYVEDYNIQLSVDLDKTTHVSKDYEAVFKKYQTPIENGITIRYQYTRLNGEKVNQRGQVSNIVANHKYSLTTSKGVRIATIGEENKDETREQIITSYDYQVSKDTLSGNDEYFFYLVENTNAKMDGITFAITMPKDFSVDDISFVDENGIELENVSYSKEGNTLYGEINQTIYANSSYGIYIILPEGYFEDGKAIVNAFNIASIIIPVGCLIFTILIWYIVCKRNELYEYTDKINMKLNSLEVGYLYHGKVKEADIVTLLFYLANKGYIKIDCTKKSYHIIKIKEYEESDRVEQAFMKALFYDTNDVTRKDLKISLNDLKEIMDGKLNEDKRRKKIFIHSVWNYKLIFWLMILVILGINITNILILYQPSYIWFNLILSAIGFYLLLYGVLKKHKVIERILYMLLGVILIIAPIVFGSYKAYLGDIFNLIVYVGGILSIIVIGYIAMNMSNRSIYGDKMYHSIKGYANYLVNMDEEEIKNNISKDSDYMYTILPYTLALGISDRWISKYKDINVKKVKWYITDNFELEKFYLEIKNIYSDLFIAMKQERGGVK